MSNPTVKILKLTSGEDIVCKTFDECKDLKDRNITITDPVILHQIRMPKGDMIVESYILSPWSALSAANVFEISADHIIVATDIKETLKDNYFTFVDAKNEIEDSEDEDEEKQPKKQSLDSKKLEEIVDRFINTLEEEHNENIETPKRRRRIIH